MVSKKDRHGNVFTVVQILRVSADTESGGGALCWGPGVDSNAIAQAMANFSKKDKTWAEFSTLGSGVLEYAVQLLT